MPTFTVTPSTGLVDGQDVDVAWSNQFIGVSETIFFVAECPATGPRDFQHCSVPYDQRPAPSGAVTIPVHRHVGTLELACGTGADQCVVELIADSGVEKGSVPISFLSTK